MNMKKYTERFRSINVFFQFVLEHFSKRTIQTHRLYSQKIQFAPIVN